MAGAGGGGGGGGGGGRKFEKTVFENAHGWQIKWRRQQQHQASNEQEEEEEEEEEEEAQTESGLQPTATRATPPQPVCEICTVNYQNSALILSDPTPKGHLNQGPNPVYCIRTLLQSGSNPC